MIEITVVPVVEVALKTFQPTGFSEVENFVSTLLNQAKKGDFFETLDGWFVPIHILESDLQSFAKYLILERELTDDLQIYGGFQINYRDEIIPTISLGSTFKFAMNMAESIINHTENEIDAYLENDIYLHLLFLKEENKIVVWIPKIKYEKTLPYKELLASLDTAREVIQQFANKIEPFLLEGGGDRISARTIRFMFGIQTATSE